jgi:hypothetical protein
MVTIAIAEPLRLWRSSDLVLGAVPRHQDLAVLLNLSMMLSGCSPDESAPEHERRNLQLVTALVSDYAVSRVVDERYNTATAG